MESDIVRPFTQVTHFSCLEVHVPPQQSRAAHTHGAHEFFICSDDGGTQFAGQDAIRQNMGDLFCFPAGMPHYCSGSPSAGGYVFIVPETMFSAETYGDREVGMALRRAVRLAGEGCNPLPVSKRTGRKVLELADDMVREFVGRAPGYQVGVKRRLMEIFLLLLRDPGIGVEPSGGNRLRSADERMASVLRFVDTHFMDTITVRAMCERAGMGRSRFHEEFRRTTGLSLIDYVTLVRIRAAQRLLRDTDARVLQVSLDCGFSSPSRFYEAFRALTGSTPGKTRGW